MNLKKWVYRIISVVLIAVVGFCAYSAWSIYNYDHETDKEVKQLEKHIVQNTNGKQILNPDWNALQSINPDIVAWVYVPDCNISYPVVQGKDNSYYLNHTIYKNSNNQGSVFLDCNTNPDFTDDNSVIYGHSVQGGGMFTLLKNFVSKQFFDNHSYFYLLTPSDNYKCNVFAFSKSTNESVFYQKSFGENRDETIQKMIAESMYTNDIDTDESMVTLSTCNLDYGLHSNQRLLLTGTLDLYEDTIYI